MSYRIGIDVGGTNTDAVVLDPNARVVSTVKTPTTPRSGDGVAVAIERVLASSAIPPHEVRAAMLGTTHCTNAIVERRGLGRVGVIRLGAPATTAVPPFEGWPSDLREAVAGPVFVLEGGNEFDGREIRPLDEAAVRSACDRMRTGVDAVAVVGVFSPVSPAHEQRVGELVEQELGLPVSLSCEIGSMGLLERENATILNAALTRTLADMAAGFRRALANLGVSADIYIGQNDGTLMQLEYALRYPVLTIGCGPTNSIRGAAHLSGVTDALVVDIGGTTTDIGVLVGGFPRQSAGAVELGGIRTNFRMPDVLSVGLGGGTIVRFAEEGLKQERVRLGPDSVGYRITQEALAFGGSTLTATDVALAAGRFDLPDGTVPAIDAPVLRAVDEAMRERLEESIDRMKPSAAPVPIVLVGGGAPIAPSSLAGVSEIIRPEHAGAANAVGAALGDIAGQTERVFSLREITRAEALSIVQEDVVARAEAAGAAPGSVEVLSVEELPVAYIEDTILIRARAAGRLA